jgi:hypothetical protein
MAHAAEPGESLRPPWTISSMLHLDLDEITCLRAVTLSLKTVLWGEGVTGNASCGRGIPKRGEFYLAPKR